MTRKPYVFLWAIVLLVGLSALLLGGEDMSGTYDIRATVIEACSCPLFCSCYYNPEPTGGHHCEFNMAYKIEDGSHYGDLDLSGAMFWISGDLGSHFGDGTAEWASVTFDKDTSEEQREAIGFWISQVFPVEFEGGVTMGEDDIHWEDGAKEANASLASGNAAIKLKKVFDAHGNQANVQDTGYFGSHSNDGFWLAHSEHYRKGDPSYEYKDKTGFMVTNRISGTIE
jgi:hypothetical protein